MKNTTQTFEATLRNGTIELRTYAAPEVAPKPQGWEYPLRTVADVKRWLREQAYSYIHTTKARRAALSEINLITRDNLTTNRNIWFG